MRFNTLKSRAPRYALMVLATLATFLHTNAQVKTSLIKGVVQNSDSEPLTGVSVVIRNLNTNFTSGTTTDSTGVFSFNRISPGGPYNFTFSMVGYENQTLTGY